MYLKGYKKVYFALFCIFSPKNNVYFGITLYI